MSKRGTSLAGQSAPGDPQQATEDADPDAVARAIVLRQLTMAARSRHQLEQVLIKRAVPDEVAQRVLDRMAAVGLVDDAAFARDYVEQRRASRGSARRSLALELRRRGINDELINESLTTIDDDSEREQARRLVQKSWASTRRLEPVAARRRLVGMLARRGYSPAIAYAVVREVESERGDPGADDDDSPLFE